MEIYDELLKRAVFRGLSIRREDVTGPQKDVIEDVKKFLIQNPNPNDAQVHQLAGQLGMDTHELEAVFYRLATMFTQLGKHRDVPDDKYDPEQIKMGIEVEKEHTDCPHIAKEIAKDHLAELPDYYTRLKQMESAGKTPSEPSPTAENPRFFTHKELRDAAKGIKK